MKSLFANIFLALGLLLGAVASHGANFPSTLNTDANLLTAVNNCGTLLTATITSGATTIGVANTSCFPTTGYFTVDNEAISYTGKTGTTFTGCTRGADGTTAASHTIGSTADQYVIAAYHNGLKNEIIAMSNYLLTGDQVHITTTTTPDMLGLGTSTPTYHLDIWGNGTDGPLAVSTSTTGTPRALAINTSGAATFGGAVSGGAGTFTSLTNSSLTNTRIPYAGSGGLLQDDADMTFNGTTATITGLSATNQSVSGNSTLGAVTATSITDSGLAATRVTFASTGGLLQDDGDFTFNGTTATITGISATSASVSGLSTLGVVNAASLTASSLTSGRVATVGTSGLIQDSSSFTFNGTTVTAPVVAVSSIQVTANASSGKVLTSDASGNATWQAAAAGKILQVVSYTSTSSTSTTSGTFTTTNLSGSITPSNTANKVFVIASGIMKIDATGASAFYTLARGGTNLLHGDGGCELRLEVGTGPLHAPCTLTYLDSPSTTSATTYAVQLRVSGSTGRFGHTGTQVLTLVEVNGL